MLKRINCRKSLQLYTSTTETDADFLLRNNYEYTQNLSLFSLKHDIRFIYASSAATYGDGSIGFEDNESVCGGLRPLNMYGYSKYLFDFYAFKNNLFDKDHYEPYKNFIDLKTHSFSGIMEQLFD